MKIALSLSGGLDSATLLAYALKLSRQPLCVNFHYPSKHNEHEQVMAVKLALHYNVQLHPVDVSGLFAALESDLLKSGGPIPEGHYEHETMKRTVVPGRNLIFIASLAALAETWGAEQVWIGAHAGDRHIYPDCRHEFIGAAADAVRNSTEDRVTVVAPFQYVDKSAIVKIGLELAVPFHLTRTCYTECPVACGKCGSCTERLEAFAKNGVRDPLEYQK